MDGCMQKTHTQPHKHFTSKANLSLLGRTLQLLYSGQSSESNDASLFSTKCGHVTWWKDGEKEGRIK